MARYEVHAAIHSHLQIGDGHHQMTLVAPPIAGAATPGQFVQVSLPGPPPSLLGRPLSISDADPDAGIIRILYGPRGSFTTRLARLQVGESLRLIGPLGNGFSSVGAARRHILVAGGIGAPPVWFLGRRMMRQAEHGRFEIDLILGARHRHLLVRDTVLERAARTVTICTEDGSEGRRGRVTDTVEEALRQTPGPCAVYACGPTNMLRSVAAAVAGHAPCQVALETPMPCGVGICDGCAVPLRRPEDSAMARCCVEGPVFEVNAVEWSLL